VARGDGSLTPEAVETFFRGVWKVAFVLALTLAILFAVGWAIQAVEDEGDSGGETATTVDES
jgi:hypothetical protein